MGTWFPHPTPWTRWSDLNPCSLRLRGSGGSCGGWGCQPRRLAYWRNQSEGEGPPRYAWRGGPSYPRGATALSPTPITPHKSGGGEGGGGGWGGRPGTVGLGLPGEDPGAGGSFNSQLAGLHSGWPLGPGGREGGLGEVKRIELSIYLPNYF